MTRLYNKKSEKEKRRYLRNNQTSPEKLVWMFLRRKQISGERFLRQYSIHSYVIDFYCPSLKLAVEIDGDSHFESDESIKYDKKRERFLVSVGTTIIRFTNQQVIENLEKVMDQIEEKVKELKNEKPHPSSPLLKGRRGGV
jgi:very-short-patch-repair endonuclease